MDADRSPTPATTIALPRRPADDLTAIPVRCASERARVLRILARWERSDGPLGPVELIAAELGALPDRRVSWRGSER
jgi:hypothetical protein